MINHRNTMADKYKQADAITRIVKRLVEDIDEAWLSQCLHCHCVALTLLQASVITQILVLDDSY